MKQSRILAIVEYGKRARNGIFVVDDLVNMLRAKEEEKAKSPSIKDVHVRNIFEVLDQHCLHLALIYSVVQKASCMFKFPAFFLPSNLGQAMQRPTAMTEQPSPNLE